MKKETKKKYDLFLVRFSQFKGEVCPRYYAANIRKNTVIINWGYINNYRTLIQMGKRNVPNDEFFKKQISQKLNKGYIASNKKEYLSEMGQEILSEILYLQECGCCGAYHPSNFHGDCRDDNNRFPTDNIMDQEDVLKNIFKIKPPKNKWS